jgi:hypothetical protein
MATAADSNALADMLGGDVHSAARCIDRAVVSPQDCELLMRFVDRELGSSNADDFKITIEPQTLAAMLSADSLNQLKVGSNYTALVSFFLFFMFSFFSLIRTCLENGTR